MALAQTIGVVIAVAGTAVAAYQDARTSFIDEKLAYAMIAAGVVLIASSMEATFIAQALAVGAVIFGIGYFLYRNGQVGGGDVLLLTAIQLLVPKRPLPWAYSLAPSLQQSADQFFYQKILEAIPFFLSVFTAASLLALVGSALLYANEFRSRKIRPKPELASGGAMAAASLVFLTWLAAGNASVVQIAFFAAVLAPAVFLTAFKKQILDEIVVQRISLSQVEDEDILVTAKMDQKIVEKYSIGRVLTKQEVEKLKKVGRKEGISKFPVAKVLPRLGPYILLGLLASLLFGDLLVFLLLK